MLKAVKVTFNRVKTIDLYITYEIKSWSYFVDNGFTLRNSLFEGVKLTKNANTDK